MHGHAQVASFSFSLCVASSSGSLESHGNTRYVVKSVAGILSFGGTGANANKSSDIMSVHDKMSYLWFLGSQLAESPIQGRVAEADCDRTGTSELELL